MGERLRKVAALFTLTVLGAALASGCSSPSYGNSSAATSEGLSPVPTVTVPDGPTTTSDESDPEVAECQKAADDNPLSVVFEPHRRMAVNQSYGISVVLALNPAAIEGSQFPASDSTTIVTISHGRCTMTVTLTGIDFDVTSTSPAEQSFISTDSLTWEWQVAPKRAGQALALKLVIQPKVNSGGGNVLLGRAQSITQTIQVDTQQENVPARVLGMADDIASNDLFRFLFPEQCRARGLLHLDPTPIAHGAAGA